MALADRITDLSILLGEEEPPTEDWIIQGWCERSSHTVLTGRGSKGKTMILNQLIVQGTTADDYPFHTDLSVKADKVVWFDAEMGEIGTRRRYWRTGLRPYVRPDRITFVDASGLDLSQDAHMENVRRVSRGADLVVFDSLRRMTHTAKENESDAMSPVVTKLTHLAHDIGPAVITIHHQGADHVKWFRGSTAIFDAADNLYGWLPNQFDGEDDGYRRLAASGPWAKTRNDRAPDDRWFQQLDCGLFAPCEKPANANVSKYDQPLRELLPFTGTKTALADACGTVLTNKAWANSYNRLVKLEGKTHVLKAEEPSI